MPVDNAPDPRRRRRRPPEPAVVRLPDSGTGARSRRASRPADRRTRPAEGGALLRYGGHDSHGSQTSHGRGFDAEWTGDVRVIEPGRGPQPRSSLGGSRRGFEREPARPKRRRGTAAAERRRRVELASLGALLVMIMVTASAAWWLNDRRSSADAEAQQAGRADGHAGAAAGLAMPPLSGAELIRGENAKPGSPEWLIEDGDKRPREIEGFTDQVSGQQGDEVRLFVTTAAPGFEAIAYRLGHYGGVGAREVWRSGPQPGVEQPECLLDQGTRMVDCSNWAPSLTVPVDEAWVPGQYLFKLVPTEGSASYVAYVVRDDGRPSDVLVISDVTTLQAYNTWGGYSLYTATEGHPGGRATRVSFDRPMDMYWGQSGTLGDSFNIGQLVESLGLDVTYATNVDQHLRPELMRNHKVIVTGFHDEYYSLEMRNGLEAARDSGVNVVFLGANAVYRRIRLEPSPLGDARHEVNYRSAAADPLTGVDPERVTTSWREAPAARPESSLTGTYYECNEGGMDADMVIVDSSAWMFAGTNVTDGQRWPGVVSEEYDRVTPSAPTPEDIQVLAHSPLTCRGQESFSDMAYYTTPSGAGVFNTGTLGFEPRLGPLCPPERLTPAEWECQLRQMTANVVTELAKGPAGRTHPARRNLAELGIE